MKVIIKTIVLAMGFMLLGSARPATASSVNTGDAVVSPVLPADLLEMRVSDFIKLTAKDISTITGKKLNLKERASFFLLKKQMKRSLKSNPDQVVKDFMANDEKNNSTLVIVIIVVVVVVGIAMIISKSLGSIF